MELIWFIISILISGLIIGALARLAIPGRTPLSILGTIGVGIAGAFIGGLIAAALGASLWVAFILEVLVATGLVYLITRNRTGDRAGSRF